MAVLVMNAFCMSLVLGATRVEAIEAKPFGITNFSFEAIEGTEMINVGKNGAVQFYEIHNKPYAFTQAGGHPWAWSTVGEFSSEEVEVPGNNAGTKILPAPTRDPKDLVVSLPAGLIGDPMAVPRCPLTQVTGSEEPCPADTQLGTYTLRWASGHEVLGPIVNVIPEAGQSAEFAFENETKEQFLLTGHLVRTAQGYGIAVQSNEIPLVGLFRFEVTVWGVPADPSHDPLRGLFCGNHAVGEGLSCAGGGEHAGVEPVPFLSFPTDCSAGPSSGTLRADSWQEPGSVREGRYAGYVEKTTGFPAVTGCSLLQFNSSIRVQPDTLLADTPVGLETTLEVPQSEQPGSKATPQLRDAIVTLPEGVSISPGIVDGIQACSESGPEGINFTGAESEEVGLSGELQLAPGHCPDASIVGTAEAVTPLLPEPVKGHVYLAKPGCGGQGQSQCTDRDALDGNLYQLYLELGGAGGLDDAGINIKVPGFVEANPATGQLTTKFLDNPQTPFSELHVSLNGGPRAPLDNPGICGPAVTNADFTPWSSPGTTPEGLSTSGTPDAVSSSFYEVLGCANPPGLSPGFVAGMVTTQAGAFSSFTMSLSRHDREQYVKGVQIHTPPGLLGMLSSVPLCGEADAQSGMCPEASRIGTTRVSSGAGSHPFEIGGNVYLTGPYGGSPFGLSIVTNAMAGPFNLGLVVVRARIDVDPETSALTITTDEAGLHAIPQIIFGVPLRLQRITVNIDRPGFMFNPTNCAVQQKIDATISGSQGAAAVVSSPFAVGGCKGLAFKPKFTASTNAHTSRAKGASLDVKLSYPAGSLGTEANIAKVKVSLPRGTAVETHDLAEGVSGGDVQREPGRVPTRIGRGHREGIDAAAPGGTVGSRVLRLPRWGSVPLAGRRSAR